MGLNKLPPEWQYYVFRRVSEDWEKFKEECPYYDPEHEKCCETGNFCSFQECPLRKITQHEKDYEEMRVILRKGSLLERVVAKMFWLIGLKPQLNVKIDGYEIDVFVNYQGRKIAIECKQYEKGSLNVRNLIHEWSSKSKELGLYKTILVIAGYRIKQEDLALARRCGVVIWDEEKFDGLFSEAIDKREAAKDKILLEIGLEPFEGYEEAVKRINERLRPMLRTLTKYSRIFDLAGISFACDLVFGLIIAGVVALLSSSLSFGQAVNFWFMSLIALGIFAAISYRWSKREKLKGILLVLKELHTIREEVTTEEIASVLPMGKFEIEELLRYLETKKKVCSPYKGYWRLK